MARRGFDRAKFDHFTEALIGFAEEYDIEIARYNDGLHIRLMGKRVVLDTWPSRGRYYILDAKTGNYKLDDRMGEKGFLPYDHNKLDQFLTELFLEDRNE